MRVFNFKKEEIFKLIYLKETREYPQYTIRKVYKLDFLLNSMFIEYMQNERTMNTLSVRRYKATSTNQE